jgi:ubiquinone/menaquinone biosynthesis C-methylase UbiE
LEDNDQAVILILCKRDNVAISASGKDRVISRGEARFKRHRDRIRKRLLKYTRKAFRMLPAMAQPRILDIGCGNGVPTLELARLSDGEITGLDRDQSLLDEVAQKAVKAGVADRVKIVRASMADMKFPGGHFDIIWAEGSIAAVGFNRGLEEWRRFLKPGGFMVVHDEKGNVRRKLEHISNCGYRLLRWFIVDEGAWWAEYYAPLDKLIRDSGIGYVHEPRVLEALRNYQREIDMFKRNPGRFSSVFFVMSNLLPARLSNARAFRVADRSNDRLSKRTNS